MPLTSAGPAFEPELSSKIREKSEGGTCSFLSSGPFLNKWQERNSCLSKVVIQGGPWPRADRSTAQKSRVTSSEQWWGHQEQFQSLGQGQPCSPPHPWQTPASASPWPCSSSCRAELTPQLWLWGITASGNIYSARNHCSWAQSSSWPSPWRLSRGFYPGCNHWLSQATQRALNY